MKKSHATIEIDLWVHDKDDDRRIYMPTKTKIVPTEILLGDGNAETGRGVSMRLAAGEYNAFVLGTTANVTIRCNQDDETISQALHTCVSLAQQAVKEYQPVMQKVLNKLVAG